MHVTVWSRREVLLNHRWFRVGDIGCLRATCKQIGSLGDQIPAGGPGISNPTGKLLILSALSARKAPQNILQARPHDPSVMCEKPPKANDPYSASHQSYLNFRGIGAA